MLGQPVADIAQRVGVARQVDAVAQRRRRLGAGGDDGEVEDGKRDHRSNLVCWTGRTKGAVAQTRRASAGRGSDSRPRAGGMIFRNSFVFLFCPLGWEFRSATNSFISVHNNPFWQRSRRLNSCPTS